MNATATRQLHARKYRHGTPRRGILQLQRRQLRLELIDPAAGVVVGDDNALNALVQIVLQPLARRDGFVASVVQGRRRMVVKVELPPA